MRGSLKQRSKGSWSIILHLGYETDPATNKRKRRQKWHTFVGTRRQAEDRLADLLKEVRDGQYVDSSDLTLGVWLREWLAAAKTKWAAGTYERYHGIIEQNLVPALGHLQLQELRATHLEAYYGASTLAAPTLVVHQTILQQALQKAKKHRLVRESVAVDLDNKPRLARNRHQDARLHCWTASDARAFLKTAIAAGPQPAAFYALALDTGARKGELCGLTWENLDLDSAKMHVVQQLLTPGPDPVFGPPKNRLPRTISLAPETVDLLRAHRQHQRELKMANRTTYRDLGLVFAKEWSDVQKRGDSLGHPLQMNNLGQREYAKLIAAAGVKPIKFHGLRHTCATLLLRAKQPVHVVSERLGHKTVSMTLEVYAHVLPDMQREAADLLGALLHGKVG
jgi:integrase